MAHVLETAHPSRTYRGTWIEVMGHQSEIPPDFIVELNVFEPKKKDADELGDFGGLTFAEAFKDLIGTVNSGPSDMAEHPEKYMPGFGETKNIRTFEP